MIYSCIMINTFERNNTYIATDGSKWSCISAGGRVTVFRGLKYGNIVGINTRHDRNGSEICIVRKGTTIRSSNVFTS